MNFYARADGLIEFEFEPDDFKNYRQEGFITELCDRIPPTERDYDEARKMWVIDDDHIPILLELMNKYYGE